MFFHGLLALQLLAVLLVLQGGCWLLARGLGRRLEGRVMALGLILPFLVLFPWLDHRVVLAPIDPLQGQIPGAPQVAASHRHDLQNDAIYCFFPWELEVRHAFKAGRLPFWSDSLEGGSSPWVNPQAQAMAPIAMLTRALPIQHHLLASMALKILLAFEGAWLLARVAGVSRRASLIAAATFALSGALFSWSVYPHSTVAAWVPWLTAAVIVMFRGGKPRAVASAAIITAALALTGQPETAAAGGIFAAITGICLARRHHFLAGFTKSAVAALLGFLLAAPHLLPFALHLPGSVRVHETLDRQLPPYYWDWKDPETYFLPGFGKHALAVMGPHVYGRPFEDAFRGPFNWVEAGSGYAGLVAFALGLFVPFLRRRRVWPFFLFGVLCLLLAGQFLPLAHVIYSFDHLKTVAWSRSLLAGSLALSIAAGLALDALWARRYRLPVWMGLSFLGGVSLSLFLAADAYSVLLWGLTGGALAVVLFAPRGPSWRAISCALLALVVLLDLVPWARRFLPMSDPGLFYPPTEFVQQIQEEMRSPGGPWRAVGDAQHLYPSLLSVWGVDEVRPHNPLAPMAYLRTLGTAFGFKPSTINYFPRFEGIDHPFLDFLGVRVVASSIVEPVPRTLERIDADYGAFYLYRNNDALPRFFLPEAAELVAKEGIADFITTLENPRKVAVDEAKALAWLGQSGDVTVVAHEPGHWELGVPGEGDRLLASSLLQPEGWATGGLKKVVVNGAFLGVHVPAGVSRVELLYRPPGFGAGLLLGFLALVLTGALTALYSWQPLLRKEARQEKP